MKRFLIGLMAVAGLVASVLTVATSAANPTSGQTAPPGTIILENVAAAYPDPFGQLRLATGVTVTVMPVGGCNPGNLAPSNNGVFTLNAPARPNIPNAIASTGLLSPSCSWTVKATNPGDSCAVGVTVRDADDNIITGTVNNGAVTLSGLNTGPLVYGTGNTPVAKIQFYVDIALDATTVAALNAIPGISGRTVAQGSCVQTFQPGVSITVPATGTSGVSAYAGTEFTVTYSSTQTGCIATGTDTFVVGRALSATTPPVASVARKAGTTQPRLISQTRAESAKINGAFCSYTPAVTPVLPENTNLGRSRFYVNQADTVTPDGGGTPTTTNTIVSTGMISGSAAVQGAAPTRVFTVFAVYTPITVSIKVTTVFPSDEVFTTADRVDYTIAINAPCGGYLALLPSGYGSQGDSASSQVFPGTTLVYGEGLRPLTVGITDQRTYRVDAYADTRGSRVCSVTVTERNGPERCSPVGGASQTVAYSDGVTELAFEFNHTCDAVESADPDDEDGGPPAPPDIGLDEDDDEDATEDSATAAEGGAADEDRFIFNVTVVEAEDEEEEEEEEEEETPTAGPQPEGRTG